MLQSTGMSRICGYRCIRCATAYPADLAIDSRGCPRCFEEAPANLKVAYDPAAVAQPDDAEPWRPALPSLWRYARCLPCSAQDAVSLGEGLTPLLAAESMGRSLDVPNLFIKDEGRNPTWSYKDRFSTVAVSVARATGASVVATASSGNAGASLAAYAARAGLRCVVVTFAGTAGPMLAQIRKYGATVVPLADKSQRWPLLAEASAKYNWFVTSPFQAPVVGSHPMGIEGYKTLAYEIAEQSCGLAPDWCVLPVCYGDALAGLWEGFKELLSRRSIDGLPRLVAAEIHGSLAATLEGTGDRVAEVKAGFETLAVSIGTTRSTFQALQALRASKGTAVPTDNRHLIRLQERLAASEGIFAELASVTPFAAIESLRRRNIIAASDRVVAIVTATGLKDLDRSTAMDAEQKVYGSVAEAWKALRAAPALRGLVDDE